jgi:hypothetical protein
MKYIAQVRKGGRLYFQTGPHDSRELAALAAFTNGPTWAMTCCTLLASQGDDGNWQLNGFYIRWHRRDPIQMNCPRITGTQSVRTPGGVPWSLMTTRPLKRAGLRGAPDKPASKPWRWRTVSDRSEGTGRFRPMLQSPSVNQNNR